MGLPLLRVAGKGPAVSFANPLPWWAVLAVTVVAGLVAWRAYSDTHLPRRRRSILTACRFVTLMLLVVLLMRPITSRGPDDLSHAVVPILVDTSRSMGIRDAGGQRRIDRARELLVREVLPALSPRFATEVLAVGEGVSATSPDALSATARRSDLRGALEAVRDRYHGRSVAGFILLSDGGDTSAAGSRIDAKFSAPVFSLGIGSPSVPLDREVLSVTAAEAVLDDSRLDLAVTAVSHGYGRTPIEIRLLENGRPAGVRRLAPAADGTPVTTIFQVAPGRGAAAIYTVEITADPGELVPENNARSVLVQPPTRPRRVLLVQGAPGFEHSFIRRAWSADSGIEVDSVVRNGTNEQGNDTFYIQASAARGPALATGFPAGLEALFAYDAVVLANTEGAWLSPSQLEATRDFVGRRGGGLLMLGAKSFLRRGLRDTPLEALLPLDLDDRRVGVEKAASVPAGANRVALTTAGQTHPIMQLGAELAESRTRWEAVPALAGIAPLGPPRPGATVLAVTDGPGGSSRPLVAVQRYGEGRSMVFTGEAAWRWRMLLPATDRSYETFWRQAVRWLALPAGDPVAIALPAGSTPGDAVNVRVAARTRAFEPIGGATVEVRVGRPDGQVDSVPAAPDRDKSGGAFLARFHAPDPGVYKVTAEVRAADVPPVTATASMLVGGADAEMSDPRLNRRVLQRLAVTTGGRMFEPGQADQLAAWLGAALPASALPAPQDLWHTGWCFAAVIILLAAEWAVRRRWGMR